MRTVPRCLLGVLLCAVGPGSAAEPEPAAGEGRPQPLWTLSHKEGVRALAFSPDGLRLATSDRLTFHLWSLVDGTEGRKFVGTRPPDQIRDVAWSPDGRFLLLGAGSYKGTGRLTLWDVRRWQEAWRYDLPAPSDAVIRVAFSPDGSRVLGGTDQGDVFVYRTQTGATVSHYHPAVARQNDRPDGFSWVLAVSPDGRTGLWAGGNSHYQLRLFSLDTGKEVIAFEPNQPAPQHVRAAAFSSDVRRVFAVHARGALRVWNVAAGTSSQTVHFSSGTLRDVAFSGGDRLALTGDDAGEVTLWDMEAVRRDPTRIYTAQVLRWNHPKRERVNEKGQTAGGVTRVALSPKDRFAAVADFDKTVRVWDLGPRPPVEAPR